MIGHRHAKRRNGQSIRNSFAVLRKEIEAIDCFPLHRCFPFGSFPYSFRTPVEEELEAITICFYVPMQMGKRRAACSSLNANQK